ncbi:MAG: hypothetical protein QOH42_200 [Blastocatellia bacterium]|jgi:hypothetical protein|nr:hypothetical protein [Blastocatellia bacterium]MDX6304385.1 hypothetical protein [Blastocatellia bacterium]
MSSGDESVLLICGALARLSGRAPTYMTEPSLTVASTPRRPIVSTAQLTQ